MTTPLTNLFLKVTNKAEAVGYEDIEKAKNEYKGRMKLIDRKEKKKFDYLTSFLNDVKNTRQLDVAKHQYDKLVSETRTYNLQIEEDNNQTTYYGIHGSSNHSSIRNTQETSAGQPSSVSQSIQNQISTHNPQQRQRSNAKERRQQEAEEFSKQASYNMKKSNPNIADLSDINRPTKIAERYYELYDNEWTEAFEDLINNFGITEIESIKLLYQINMEAYKFASKVSDSQVKTLYNRLIAFMVSGLKGDALESDEIPPEEDKSILRQIRKEMAAGCIKDMQTNCHHLSSSIHIFYQTKSLLLLDRCNVTLLFSIGSSWERNKFPYRNYRQYDCCFRDGIIKSGIYFGRYLTEFCGFLIPRDNSGNKNIISFVITEAGVQNMKFKNERLPQILKDSGDPGKELETINIFTKKCVEIAWWMCVQDPPVEMCDTDVSSSPTDNTKYRAYTRSGNKIDFIVWPCILLCKSGPVLCKGVAQFK